MRRENKVLYERIVDTNESIDIPWNKMYDSLKFLYPGSIIQFAML